MKTIGKVLIGVLATGFVVTAGYFFVWKPFFGVPTEKKEEENEETPPLEFLDENGKPTNTGIATSVNQTPRPPLVKAFKKDQMLYSKADNMAYYTYPEAKELNILTGTTRKKDELAGYYEKTALNGFIQVTTKSKSGQWVQLYIYPGVVRPAKSTELGFLGVDGFDNVDGFNSNSGEGGGEWVVSGAPGDWYNGVDGFNNLHAGPCPKNWDCVHGRPKPTFNGVAGRNWFENVDGFENAFGRSAGQNTRYVQQGDCKKPNFWSDGHCYAGKNTSPLRYKNESECKAPNFWYGGHCYTGKNSSAI